MVRCERQRASNHKAYEKARWKHRAFLHASCNGFVRMRVDAFVIRARCMEPEKSAIAGDAKTGPRTANAICIKFYRYDSHSNEV